MKSRFLLLVMALLTASLLLSACAAAPTATPTPVPPTPTKPAAAPTPSTAPSAPTVTAAPAAPAARTISGRITYEGTVQPLHQIVIVANRQGEQAPAYSTILRQPGPYSIPNVTDASYTLIAFMDLGDDMGPPGANEPYGTYDANADGKPDEVVIKDGKGLAGVDIAVRDRK